MYRSPVMFLDRWYPCFSNFKSVVPIDVIRVKSYVDSLTLRAYQCKSRSINFTSFQSGWWPVLLVCSQTAEVWVRASRISLSCSLILSCIDIPVSPM